MKIIIIIIAFDFERMSRRWHVKIMKTIENSSENLKSGKRTAGNRTPPYDILPHNAKKSIYFVSGMNKSGTVVSVQTYKTIRYLLPTLSLGSYFVCIEANENLEV